MQWLLTSHVRRYHQHYGSSGHVWQGRFNSFPVQRHEYLITVLRYVLQNPVRAGLSSTAREWLWSSLRRPQLVDASPVGDEEQLAEPIQEDQLATVCECLNRQRPFGRKNWQAQMAAAFGLASTLRPRGRPRSEKKSSLSPLIVRRAAKLVGQECARRQNYIRDFRTRPCSLTPARKFPPPRRHREAREGLAACAER